MTPEYKPQAANIRIRHPRVQLHKVDGTTRLTGHFRNDKHIKVSDSAGAHRYASYLPNENKIKLLVKYFLGVGGGR